MPRPLLILMLVVALALVGLGPLPATAAPYDAAYTPAATPTLTAGQVITVQVTIKNTGTLTWTPTGPNPFRLGYHWYAKGAVPAGSVPTTPAPTYGAVVFNGLRTNLPQAIPPGITVPLTAQLQAPPTTGTYVLKWDLVLRPEVGPGPRRNHLVFLEGCADEGADGYRRLASEGRRTCRNDRADV